MTRRSLNRTGPGVSTGCCAWDEDAVDLGAGATEVDLLAHALKSKTHALNTEE